MNNFISKNKKVLVIFLIFLSLAIASYIYINQTAVIENQNYSPSPHTKRSYGVGASQVLDDQNQLDIKQVQQESAVQEENIKIPESTSTLPEAELAGERHIIYVGEKRYEISIPGKSTVYDLMSALEQKGKIDFKGSVSAGLGFFVDEINGQKNSPSNNEFWIYYINNKAAQVGVSNYILKPNDIINWKYEKPQF